MKKFVKALFWIAVALVAVPITFAAVAAGFLAGAARFGWSAGKHDFDKALNRFGAWIDAAAKRAVERRSGAPLSEQRAASRATPLR